MRHPMLAAPLALALALTLALALALTACQAREGAGNPAEEGLGAARDTLVTWPNPVSSATSDPWIVANHDNLRVMRPRVLALNFVNARSNDEMLDLFEEIFAGVREGTRPHGYTDPEAAAFLEYEVAYAVDLTDDAVPEDWPYNNSSIYPREDPVEGTWGFDYERLFTEEFAELYGVEDPEAPGSYLSLCEMSERGLVHEVWVYGDADVPDVGAAEILGIQPVYDESFRRTDAPMNRCSGNGCFDDEDLIPSDCTRTLRIGWVNNTRGPGCFMESISHGIEWMGRSENIPYWTPYFEEFGGLDLDERLGLPFDSWYHCEYGQEACLAYPSSSSVEWNVRGRTGTLDPYVPICGNVHFPPNARNHYDVGNDQPVLSTCRTYRTQGGPGSDPAAPTSAADWAAYREMANDCDGPWLVWWWQNFPGAGSAALDDSGAPMKNWWPFIFY